MTTAINVVQSRIHRIHRGRRRSASLGAFLCNTATILNMAANYFRLVLAVPEDADVAAAGASGVANAPIRYRIEEELPVGTAVGNLIDDAGLRQRYEPEVIDRLRFRFVSAADAASPPPLNTAVANAGLPSSR